MNPIERRNYILQKLENTNEPISGNELAKELNVTRQIVVSDIALIRADNKNILSTNKGYILFHDIKKNIPKRTFCVMHKEDEILKEFVAIIESGGRIRDVIVEHDMYGSIIVDLIINNMDDAKHFIMQKKQSHSKSLSNLTNGIHFHTVEADEESILDKIQENLDKIGVLCKILSE